VPKGLTSCVDFIQQKVKVLPLRLFLIVVLFSQEIIMSVTNFYTDLTKFLQLNYVSYFQIF
jgi:hypothetical protein